MSVLGRRHSPFSSGGAQALFLRRRLSVSFLLGVVPGFWVMRQFVTQVWCSTHGGLAFVPTCCRYGGASGIATGTSAAFWLVGGKGWQSISMSAPEVALRVQRRQRCFQSSKGPVATGCRMFCTSPSINSGSGSYQIRPPSRH